MMGKLAISFINNIIFFNFCDNYWNTMFNIIKLNEKDNIGIASMDIPENSDLNIGIKSKTKVPYGHKISIKDIKKGDFIFRYGQIIGVH